MPTLPSPFPSPFPPVPSYANIVAACVSLFPCRDALLLMHFPLKCYTSTTDRPLIFLMTFNMRPICTPPPSPLFPKILSSAPSPFEHSSHLLGRIFTRYPFNILRFSPLARPRRVKLGKAEIFLLILPVYSVACCWEWRRLQINLSRSKCPIDAEVVLVVLFSSSFTTTLTLHLSALSYIHRRVIIIIIALHSISLFVVLMDLPRVGGRGN